MERIYEINISIQRLIINIKKCGKKPILKKQ